MDEKLLEEFVSVGILYPESISNFPARPSFWDGRPTMHVQYAVGPHPDVTFDYAPHIILGQCSFTQVTGIAQSGTRARVDIVISVTPTETALRVFGIVHKLLQQEGIDEAALESKKETAAECRELLWKEQELYRRSEIQRTWGFTLYDDGWRVG